MALGKLRWLPRFFHRESLSTAYHDENAQGNGPCARKRPLGFASTLTLGFITTPFQG